MAKSETIFKFFSQLFAGSQINRSFALARALNFAGLLTLANNKQLSEINNGKCCFEINVNLNVYAIMGGGIRCVQLVKRKILKALTNFHKKNRVYCS
jgi:hypothetical protein